MTTAWRVIVVGLGLGFIVTAIAWGIAAALVPVVGIGLVLTPREEVMTNAMTALALNPQMVVDAKIFVIVAVVLFLIWIVWSIAQLGHDLDEAANPTSMMEAYAEAFDRPRDQTFIECCYCHTQRPADQMVDGGDLVFVCRHGCRVLRPQPIVEGYVTERTEPRRA